MKRQAPKEVWLFHSGRWNFSFDPPTKRFVKRCHRMVTEAEVERLRHALKHIHDHTECLMSHEWARAALKPRKAKP